MKRKGIACLMSFAMVAACVAGCSSKSKTSGSPKAKVLNVLTWEGDVAQDQISKFEKENGVKVNITYVEDTNTILAKMLQGSNEYDVIDVESAYMKSFVDAGLLAEIDYDSMKNYGNMEQTYSKKGAIGDEKFKYSVPISGALYTGVVINKEKCPIKITSFQDLANPALKGKIWCTNATISLYAGALKGLGYSPNSSDEGELNQAQELLKKIKPNIKAFGASSVSPMETEDCAVAYTYDYNILMNDDKANWEKFEIIPDTTLGYTQYWTIAASSDKKELANKFIDYSLSVDAAVAIAKEWGGVPVVKTELLKDKLDKDYFKNPMMKQFADMWPDHTDLAVSDKQTAIMDTLYNKLMSGE